MSINEISSKDSWRILQENKNSILIDVRDSEELKSSGSTDLSSINAKSVNISWRFLPNMDLNESFSEELSTHISKFSPNTNPKEIKLLFLCRSGVRSFDSATLMANFGYDCYNIINGFEGKNNNGQQTESLNWKEQNLPWRQI
jgi:rhodanese-related sulfurtransferase